MKPFVAIDFETADAKRDSACAIGLARVEGARVVYTDAVLIKPPRGIAPANQAVHGIKWDDVKNASTFAEVWAKVLPILNGVGTLAAHNVSFDRSVLNACCGAAGIDPPKVEWVCTLELAKKRWPKPASHKLPDVCRYLGVKLTAHHHAGADAEAAARVLIAMEGRTEPAPASVTDERPTELAPQLATPTDSEVARILARIPLDRHTTTVLNLMRDAHQLGPLHAADLVLAVERWFTRTEPGRNRCRCGKPCTLLCDLCTECIASLA